MQRQVHRRQRLLHLPGLRDRLERQVCGRRDGGGRRSQSERVLHRKWDPRARNFGAERPDLPVLAFDEDGGSLPSPAAGPLRKEGPRGRQVFDSRLVTNLHPLQV